MSALAIHVFLSTYAPSGVSAEVAREALDAFSEGAILARITDPCTSFVLAVRGPELVGFAEVRRDGPSRPLAGVGHVELARLYVAPGAQRQGVGSALLNRAEDIAREAGAKNLWLTVWAGNDRAISFYRALSYRELGTTHFVMGKSSYENLVMAKDVSVGAKEHGRRTQGFET